MIIKDVTVKYTFLFFVENQGMSVIQQNLDLYKNFNGGRK